MDRNAYLNDEFGADSDPYSDQQPRPMSNANRPPPVYLSEEDDNYNLHQNELRKQKSGEMNHHSIQKQMLPNYREGPNSFEH